MARRVGIIGIGQTKHGNRSEITYPDLVREAVVAALKDANITPEDIEGIVFGTMPSMMEGVALNHLYLADALCAVGKPILKTETCGSTGVSLALTGYYWVASGMADLIMVVGSEKMHEGDSQATMTTVAEPFYLRYFLSGAPGVFALQSHQWSHRYNIPDKKAREAATKLSYDHHKDALDNPYAHIKKELSVEEIENAKVVVYPIRLWDVCPNSDGACALIFASEEMVKRLGRDAAWIKGVGYRGDEYWFGDSDKVRWQSAIEAAKEAYKMAGITNPRKELDVAEIYNPFTYLELAFLECFGFSEPGKAADDTLKGTFSRDGELPCDPSGGVLCTNPIGATGLVRVAEASLQVLGRAGSHQIDGAKLAFAHAMGGISQFNGVMIVGSE